jgi:hypothetical protein
MEKFVSVCLVIAFIGLLLCIRDCYHQDNDLYKKYAENNYCQFQRIGESSYLWKKCDNKCLETEIKK